MTLQNGILFEVQNPKINPIFLEINLEQIFENEQALPNLWG